MGSLDVESLHFVLSLRANNKGQLRINQAALANELGVDPPTVSKTIKVMVAEKRLRKIGHDYHTPLYKVIPVDEWRTTCT